MAKITIILILFSIGSKFLGLIRDIVMAYYYGTSSITDIYVISTTITTVIMGFIGAAISTSFIPIVSQIEKTLNRLYVNKFVSNLLYCLLILSFLIVIVIHLFTKNIVILFASGFDESTINITVNFTRITIFSIFFLIFVNIFKPYIQLFGEIWVLGLMGYSLNVILIISLITSYYLNNIYLLAYGVVIAYIVQFFTLYPFMRKADFKITGNFNVKDENLKKIIKLSLPVLIGVSINQINTIVDRTLASQVIEGGVSAIDYASKVNGLVEGIFISSLITVLFPMMVKSLNENNQKQFKEKISSSIYYTSIILIPITLFIFIFSKELITLLYGRGNFNHSSILLTSGVLKFYSIGIIVYGVRTILYNSFYSLHDTKTPMINSSISMVLNIILNIIFVKFYGLNGLAFATSLSAIICTVLLYYHLQKRIGTFPFNPLKYIKVVLVSVLTIILTSLVNNSILFLGEQYSFIISAFMFFIFYVLLSIIFKIKGFIELINVFLKNNVRKNIQ